MLLVRAKMDGRRAVVTHMVLSNELKAVGVLCILEQHLLAAVRFVYEQAFSVL